MLCRTLVMLALTATFVGCRAKPRAAVPVAQLSGERSVAIAQDPPAVLYADRLDLSRDGRGEAAFVGYRETVATYEYLRQDDRELHYTPWGGVFDRRAVSERVSLSYR